MDTAPICEEPAQSPEVDSSVGLRLPEELGCALICLCHKPLWQLWSTASLARDKRCRLPCWSRLEPRPRDAPGVLERLHCLCDPLATEDAHHPAECNFSKSPSRAQGSVFLLSRIRPLTHQWQMPAYSRMPIDWVTQRWRFWHKHLCFMYSQATVRSYTTDRAVLQWDHTFKRGTIYGGCLKLTPPTSVSKPE